MDCGDSVICGKLAAESCGRFGLLRNSPGPGGSVNLVLLGLLIWLFRKTLRDDLRNLIRWITEEEHDK